MKILKICTLMVLMIGVALIWTSCQKELSGNPSNSTVSNEKQKSGVVQDDPVAVGKVPVLMSSDFITNGFQATSSSDLLSLSRGGRDRTSPSVSVASPTNGSVVSGTVNIAVNATDNIGVSSVNLYIDGGTTPVQTSSTSPFTNSWISGTVANGTHTLKVIASDGAGNTGVSSVSVTVNNTSVPVGDIYPPSVSISSPAGGSIFNLNITVPVTVNASDAVGVTSVKLYVDNSSTPLSTSITAPFTNSLNTGNLASGGHTLTAKAFDAAGNQGTSNSVSITVNTTSLPPITLGPNVTLQMPVPGQQGSEGTCVAFPVVYGVRSSEQYYKSNGTIPFSNGVNVFSPEYVYNQVKFSDCSSGTTVLRCLDLLVSQGACTWNSMPYDWNNGCSLMPNSSQQAEAANYKIKSYSKIDPRDQTAMKTMLASKHALIATFNVDQSFYNIHDQTVWSAYSGIASAPHGITICGYDDAKHAYLAMNSWGTTWGFGGYCWIDYNFLGTISGWVYTMAL